MRTQIITAALAAGALAARPFLNEADTGIDGAVSVAKGELPKLTSIVGLPDFDWAARNYLPLRNYTYYRNGAGGEWSYRHNLEAFSQYAFKPRVMVDITNIENTLSTTILGNNVSAPFFISPCARGGYGHVDAELNLAKAAGSENIMYMASIFATKTIEEIAAVKKPGQVLFQHFYLSSNDTENQQVFERSEKAGAKAMVFTIDSAADGNRHRAARFGVGSADSSYTRITWEIYNKLQKLTKLPIILKGINSVADAKLAVEHGAPAIMLSNHGGRQLDGSMSPFETAIELHKEAPEVFKKIDVLVDGGVRYGADVLKLLALGVKAVGLGRPFMYANVYGQEGVQHAIKLLKHEIAIDAGNLGVGDLRKIDDSYVKWTPSHGWA